MSLSNVRTLLVDLDGTLLGSRSKLSRKFIYHSIQYFRKQGLSTLKSLIALHKLRVAIEIHQPGVLNADRAAQALAEFLNIPTEHGRKLAREMAEDVFSNLEDCFFPIPGAQKFIDWARPKYKLILATNAVWTRDIVELRMRWGGIDPAHFQFIVNNGELCSCKPSVTYYSELVEKLKLNPQECLMIGDSEKKDLPAKEVGIPVFLLTSGDSLREREPQVWFGNWAALQMLLERI